MTGTGNPPAGDGGATRRNVLKGATAAVGAFIALEAIGGVSLAAGASPKPTALSNGVIYPDPTLCIGCLNCEVICSQVHKQAGLSDLPRIRIYNDPNTKVDPEVLAAYPGRGSFHQEPCLQCPTAECLYVCPVNALRVEPTTGARFIREDVCVACNRCAEACIFPTSPEANATNQLKYGQESRISYDPVKDNFTKTRAQAPARTPTPQPRDEADVEQSVANARAMVEKALASPTLPAIEDLLLETVALAAPTGGDQLTRAAAARWLRQRATARIQVIQFERHQHQALINANTRGWSAIAPLTSSQLAFMLRQYDAAGAQDPDRGKWLIDVLEAE